MGQHASRPLIFLNDPQGPAYTTSQSVTIYHSPSLYLRMYFTPNVDTSSMADEVDRAIQTGFVLHKMRDYAASLPQDIATTGGIVLPAYHAQSIYIESIPNLPFITNIFYSGSNGQMGQEVAVNIRKNGQKGQTSPEKRYLQTILQVPPDWWIGDRPLSNAEVPKFQPSTLNIQRNETYTRSEHVLGGLHIQSTPLMIRSPEAASIDRADEEDFKIDIILLDGVMLPDWHVKPSATATDLRNSLARAAQVPQDNIRMFTHGCMAKMMAGGWRLNALSTFKNPAVYVHFEGVTPRWKHGIPIAPCNRMHGLLDLGRAAAFDVVVVDHVRSKPQRSGIGWPAKASSSGRPPPTNTTHASSKIGVTFTKAEQEEMMLRTARAPPCKRSKKDEIPPPIHDAKRYVTAAEMQDDWVAHVSIP